MSCASSSPVLNTRREVVGGRGVVMTVLLVVAMPNILMLMSREKVSVVLGKNKAFPNIPI